MLEDVGCPRSARTRYADLGLSGAKQPVLSELLCGLASASVEHPLAVPECIRNLFTTGSLEAFNANLATDHSFCSLRQHKPTSQLRGFAPSLLSTWQPKQLRSNVRKYVASCLEAC